MPKRSFHEAFGKSAVDTGDRITKSGSYSIDEKVAASALKDLARPPERETKGAEKEAVALAVRPANQLTEASLRTHDAYAQSEARASIALRLPYRGGR